MRRSNIFNDMARDMVQAARKRAAGKIERSPFCGYVLGAQGWYNPNGVFLKSSKDIDGKDISLTGGSFVSNCPQPPDGSEATPHTRKGYWLRIAVCNKCPHHLPGMCCAILREQGKNAHREALTEFTGCISQAIAATKEIIK